MPATQTSSTFAEVSNREGTTSLPLSACLKVPCSPLHSREQRGLINYPLSKLVSYFRSCSLSAITRQRLPSVQALARMEVAAAAAVRPCRGYLAWLALQCLVRLVATQNGFEEARWLLVAVAAVWVFVEVGSKMLDLDDPKTALAHALAVCMALAGVALQKALFFTVSVAHPVEREMFFVLGDSSKLALMLIQLPTSELLLLLVVDSLLQLLLLQHVRMAAPKEFVGSFSVLLAANLSFLALPLLLHVFKPWPSTAERAAPMLSAEEQQQAVEEEEEDAAVKAAAALVVTAVAAGAPDGADILRSVELEDSALNLTAFPERPREAATSRDPVDLMKLLYGNGTAGRAPRESLRKGPATSDNRQPPLASVLLMEKNVESAESPVVILTSDDLDDRTPAQRLKDAELYRCIFRRKGRENGPHHNTTFFDGPIASAQKNVSGTSGAVARDPLWPSASPRTETRRDVQEESPSITPPSNMDAASRCIMAALWQTPELKQAATEPRISGGLGHKSPHAHTEEVSANARDIKKPLSPTATKKQPQRPGDVIIGLKASGSPEATALTNLARQDLLKHLQEQTAKAKEQLRQQQDAEATILKRGREGRGLRSFEGSVFGDTKNDNSQQQQSWMRRIHAEPLRTSSPKPTKSEGVSIQGARQASPLCAHHKLVMRSSGVAPPSAGRGQGESGRARLDSSARGKAEEGSERPKQRRRETEEESFGSTEASSIYKATREESGIRTGQQPPHRHDHSPLGAAMHHHRHCPLNLHKVHEEQHDLLPPPPGLASGAATAEEWKKETPCRKRSSKLLEVPPEPVIPVVVQPPPPADNNTEGEGNRDRNSAFDPAEKRENSGREAFLAHHQPKGAGAKAQQRSPSPAVRSVVLDPFASPSAQSKSPPHSVFWGRAGAFGASGTPMVSPRLPAGPNGSRKAVDDSEVHRQSELPFGVERRFQPSPNITLRCIDTSELEAGDAASANNWRDRGDPMHAGAKQFFGTPFVLSRDPKLQGPSGKMRNDINRLRELAVQRRGKCMDSKSANKEEARLSMKNAASPQPSPVPISYSPPPHTPIREGCPHLTPLGESSLAEAAEDSDKSLGEWRGWMRAQDADVARILGPPPGFKEIIGDLSRAAVAENQSGAQATGDTPIVIVTPLRLSPGRSPEAHARSPGRSQSPGLVTIGGIPLSSAGNSGLDTSESGEAHYGGATGLGIEGMFDTAEQAAGAGAEGPIIVTPGPLLSEGLDWEDVENEDQQRSPALM
ncbi:hypothetical protein Esti_001768 [Eimeria stiedai]